MTFVGSLLLETRKDQHTQRTLHFPQVSLDGIIKG